MKKKISELPLCFLWGDDLSTVCLSVPSSDSIFNNAS